MLAESWQLLKRIIPSQKETLAVVFALKSWRLYLFKHFEIFTDNQAVVLLRSKLNMSKREARWIEFLADFDFSIQHISGNKNFADPLTRQSNPWVELGSLEFSLEFFPRAVPDQCQCRPRFSISGSNLTIVLYEGSIFITNTSGMKKKNDFTLWILVPTPLHTPGPRDLCAFHNWEKITIVLQRDTQVETRPNWTQMGPACSRDHLPLQTWHCSPWS